MSTSPCQACVAVWLASERAAPNIHTPSLVRLDHTRSTWTSTSDCGRTTWNDGGNGRLLHNQLVAVRPSDASGFTLATVRWLEVSHDFELRTGLRLLPGAPKAIAIRPFGLNAMNEKYVPALSLPELPALKVPAPNVARARQLLAEAGFPNGFRMVLNFSNNVVSKKPHQTTLQWR